MAALAQLYAFRYRDPQTGRWVRARRRATIEQIRERYVEWELVGRIDVRGRASDRWQPLVASRSRQRRVEFSERGLQLHPQRAHPAAIDSTEAFLLGLFLGRYVTYCMRRGRFAAMNGAVGLLREVQTLER